MKVVFLGTGASAGVPKLGCGCASCGSRPARGRRRRRSSLLVTSCSGVSVLIDTAPELREQVLRLGIVTVDALLLTHGHPDHILGFYDFHTWMKRMARRVPVIADSKTIGVITTVFGVGGLPAVDLIPLGALEEVSGSQVFDIGDVRAMPMSVPHGPKEASVAYMLEERGSGERLGYVTDCSVVPAEVMRQLEGVRLLVLGVVKKGPDECHLSLERVTDIVRQLRPKRTILTHMSHEITGSDVKGLGLRNVRAAEDGLRIKV